MQPILVALGGADCERIGASWLAQPANAVSSLAYVAAGGWLLRRAVRLGTGRAFVIAAGTSTAAVGLASVAYHGPQPAWAGPAHDGSIAWLGLVLVGHAAWRLTQDSGRLAAGYAAPCLAAFALLGGTGRAGLLVPVTAVAVVAGAALTSRSAGGPARVAPRCWLAGAWGAAGLVAYQLGRTGSLLCRPDSVWQWHAAWHVLSAVALGATVLGFAETPEADSSGARRAAQQRAEGAGVGQNGVAREFEAGK